MYYKLRGLKQYKYILSKSEGQETDVKVWTEPHFSGGSMGELCILWLVQFLVIAGISSLMATLLQSHQELCVGWLSLYLFS